MELTEKNYKNRISEISDLLNDPDGTLSQRLNEKGVECTLILPLLEVVLGYNSIHDIQYEVTSKQRHKQRFDFLVADKLIVEAKPIRVQFTDEIVKQLSDYIGGNAGISFGLLSNGYDYSIFADKKHLEAKAERPLHQIQGNALNVLTLDIADPDFFSIIELLKKETMEKSLDKIADYAVKLLLDKRGHSSAIHDEKKLDKRVKELIQQTLDVKHGDFFQNILDKEIEVGTLRRYKDDCILIEYVIQSDGRICVRKGGVQIFNMQKILEEKTLKPAIEKSINKWGIEDTFYSGEGELLKDLTDMKKLMSRVSDKYVFKNAPKSK